MKSLLSNLSVVFLVSTVIKALLMFGYRSTDFEVHRNWLAITHTLPLRDWYFENRSIWTLDYPPFFAYFEYFLSFFASLVDPQIVNIDNLNYSSTSTILFQRFSVQFSDIILFIGLYRYLATRNISMSKSISIGILVLCNIGLFFVDHIHFQYNGILLGLLLLCLDSARRGYYHLVAVYFSILVLMKHLFAPLALIFGVFLVDSYCLAPFRSKIDFNSFFLCFRRFLQLATIALLLVALAIGPIWISSCIPSSSLSISRSSHPVLLGSTWVSNFVIQIQQLIARMFPFGRGLVHAYWAPNIYAIYCFMDKILGVSFVQRWISKLAAFGGIVIDFPVLLTSTLPREKNPAVVMEGLASSTSGLVGDFVMNFLPTLSPFFTFVLLLLTFLPFLFRVVWTWVDVIDVIQHKECKENDINPSNPSNNVDIETITTTTASSQYCHGKSWWIEQDGLEKSVIYCLWSVFMVGYHVHEKALLIPMILQALLAFTSQSSAFLFLQIMMSGGLTLFPLLFPLEEVDIKGLLWICMTVFSWLVVKPYYRWSLFQISFLVIEAVIMMGLFVFHDIIHPLVFIGPSGEAILPFLPLMMISVVCAIFHCFSWMQILYQLLKRDNK